jgi:integrase
MDRGEARKIARQYLGSVGENTSKEYARAFARLDGMNWRDYSEEHKATKRTSGVLRSAWRRSIASQLIDAIERSERSDSPDERRAARARMDALAMGLVEDANAAPYQPPEGAPRAGAGSKRKTLRKLPPDWRAQMYAAANNDDRLRIWALACGARPEELRKGVLLEAIEGRAIRLTIRGAKTSVHSGQEQRVLTISNPDELLGEMRLEPGLKIMIASDTGQAFQKRMTRLATKLRFKEVTPYSFRHAFSADLKRSGMTTNEIARAMGHQSEKMQRNYGHAKQSRSGRRIEVTATATTPPRPEKVKLAERLNKTPNIVVMQDLPTNTEIMQDSKTKTPSQRSKSPSPWDF